jgi:LysM repeat protein
LADRGWRAEFKRYAAPVAFLAAVTIAVLLVRAGLQTDSSTSSTTPKTKTITTTQATTSRRPRPQYYRLRAGETISDVALRFTTTVAALLALNPRIQPTQLSVGQRIRVR